MFKHRFVSLVVATVFAVSGFVAVVDGRPALAEKSDKKVEKKGPWKKVMNKKGIKVHRRKVPGTNLNEFRGRGIVEVPITRIMGVLGDSEHRTEWMHKCVGSQELKKIDEYNHIVYNRTDAPWPVSDRDTVLRGRVTIEVPAKRIAIRFHNVEHASMPPVKGAVRMPFLRGHWILEPINEGKHTHVEYQVHANPGGSLPQWLANLVSKKLPYKTLEGLRKQVQLKRYPKKEALWAASPDIQAILGKSVVTAKNDPAKPAPPVAKAEGKAAPDAQPAPPTIKPATPMPPAEKKEAPAKAGTAAP